MACCPCRRRTSTVVPSDSHTAHGLAERQALLIQLSTALACEPLLENMLQTLADVAHTVLRCERVWLIVEAHEETTEHIVRHQAPNDGEIQVTPVSVCQHVWNKGEAQNIPDMNHVRASSFDQEANACRLAFENEFKMTASIPKQEVVSVLCIPMKDENNKVWGVVHAINKHGDGKNELCPFSAADSDMLNFLASLCVRRLVDYNISRKRKMRSNRKVRSLLQLLADSFNVSRGSDVTKFVGSILLQAQVLFECERTNLYAVDSYRNQLKGYDFKSKEDPPSLQKTVMPLEGLISVVAITGEVMNIKDAWKDCRFTKQRDIETNFRTHSLLMAPLKTSGGKVVAVLQCVNKVAFVNRSGEGQHFSAEDETEVRMIGSIVSDVLQRVLVKSEFADIMEQEDFDQDVKDMLTTYARDSDYEQNHRYSRCTRPTLSGNLRKSRTSTLASADMAFCIKSMATWNFDHWHSLSSNTENGSHTSYVAGCLEHLTLLHTFNFSRVEICRIVRIFRDSYSKTTQYHTWDHAFSTFHLVFAMCFRGLLDVISLLDLLSLLLAALGHDIEHPGVNNQCLVHKRDVLALRYNDISVLENHHASVAITILRDFVQRWERETQARFRKVVVTAILGTDMANHEHSIKWLQTTTSKLSELRRDYADLDDKEALHFCTVVLHCADVSHPTLSWPLHRRLSLLCAQEFFAQFQEEEKLGLPTLPFMGKDPENLPGLAPSQKGFIQFVVQPLWSGLESVTKGKDDDAPLKDVLHNVSTNQQIWQGIMDGKEEPPIMESKSSRTLSPVSAGHHLVTIPSGLSVHAIEESAHAIEE